jgi:TetR/AcrR family transcriptional regulator
MTETTPIRLSQRTQSERADETRTRIIASAIRQFSMNGLSGARTELIAKEAGVNKALLYYYFQGKEALYAAALDEVAERVRATSMAVLEAEGTAGERFLRAALNHFDRIHSNPGFQSLMQQEMIRMHRGEENALTTLAEKVFKPLMTRLRSVLHDGIASGELIDVDPAQFQLAAYGTNVFYFLSAPLMRLTQGEDPLEHAALERQRKTAIEYLGKTIFVDRRQGALLAEKVLAATPMPVADAAMFFAAKIPKETRP